ncbi:hypothetical protein HanXRQr2_Chr13g0579641 [Helianthus annuus]|uniref:Uncharacterized protein n=1 Tax=Helianthus annuus TaxID=4232 RepID=A0A9K3HAZ4_HELAN|nr:hypothetical protein HanXRQr2_Chr13g0579641 [Helianthus annuus]
MGITILGQEASNLEESFELAAILRGIVTLLKREKEWVTLIFKPEALNAISNCLKPAGY